MFFCRSAVIQDVQPLTSYREVVQRCGMYDLWSGRGDVCRLLAYLCAVLPKSVLVQFAWYWVWFKGPLM
jgi:hypothetical protein